MSLESWKTALGKAIIPEERVWLRDAAEEIAGRFESPVIVNIGIFRGATLYCLRAGAPHARLVGIDIAYPQGAKLDPKARVEVIVGDSGKLWAKFDAPVHLLFIDGDHSYKAVRRDIAGWTPKVVPGGIVCFHDFKTEPKVAAKHAGVKQAILEWAETAQWEQLPDVGSLRAYRRLTRITDQVGACGSCGWKGTVEEMEPDVDGDGSLGCPECGKIVEVRA